MTTILDFKCPCCGGKIEFEPNLQKLKCPYCDTEFDIDTLKNYDEEIHNDKDYDMNWDSASGSEWNETEGENLGVYICNSCGGEIIGDENTGATSCPFCGNPVVFKKQFSGELRPDFVIPFKLDKKAAKEGFKKHLKNKKLLPKLFKSDAHIDEIKGIYVPFWLFDADVHANIRYKGTKVRAWSDSNYNYTETSFFAVSREGDIGFDRVPVDGSSKLDDTLMESVEPYDFSEAVDFETAYLSGYFADKYDVPESDCILRANQRIKNSTENAFRDTAYGYTTLITENSNVQLSDGKTHYALYPVWILNTTWKGQKYVFAMNGQTGKFVGDLPVDKGAYWKYFGMWSGIVFAASLLITWLLGL